MPDSTGPVLLVVGGDAKRLQWLNHHVTSHWPSAQVTTVPAPDAESLTRFVEERSPDAVILQIDFGNEAQAGTGLSSPDSNAARAAQHLLHHTRRTRQ